MSEAVDAAVEGAGRDPLDLLSEQFLQQYRAGEPVTVDSFADRHAAHGEALRELLPALVALEQIKRERESSGSSASRVALPKLERLGDFRIVRELGRGGMGVVFEAVQETLDRRVALKVLPQASLLTANQLERFQREAQTAARLHHTHIVPVYGSGESDGYHWYAMQFIAGQSLDRWREQQAQRPPQGSGAWAARARFLARIGAAAADALHCAHGLGTLHRDIKPGNFLLDHDDHLWITDFGLAKALEGEGLTHSGDLVGTLQYMAPEQFAGHYDQRSEVYALGVTLYELLTLQPAFRGKNRSELMERVREQRLDLSLRSFENLPRDLVVIVEKAMARDPKDRYGDALLLQHDLEAFLEDRPIQARPLSVLGATWRWCRRNRGLAAALGAAALAVMTAAVTGWVAYGVTGEALQREKKSAVTAKQESARAVRESERSEGNLKLTLAAFVEMFDALVGPDATLAVEDAPDTGEQALLAHTPLSARDVKLLQKMLAFYDEFAAQNAESESLRYETARAYRRVGAIHARLGETGSLEAALAALQKSRDGLLGVTRRDVQRDLAGVSVELGLVEERLRRHDAADVDLREGLRLYEQLASAESVPIRLERAKVMFAIARNKLFEAPTRERGGRPGRLLDVLTDVQRASQQVHALHVDSPNDPEVQLLYARAQVLVVRTRKLLAEDVPGRGDRPDGERLDRLRHALERMAGDPASTSGNALLERLTELFAVESETRLSEAIVALRSLVTAHPERADFQFELCEAILEGHRSPSRGRSERGPEEPGSRRADAIALLRTQLNARVPLLREADTWAKRLFGEQPLFLEYRALYGRTQSELGQALLQLGRIDKDDALLREARAALEQALEVQEPLLAKGAFDPRFLRLVCDTHGQIGLQLLQDRDAAGARQHAVSALDLAERTLNDAATGEPRGRPIARRDERPFSGWLQQLVDQLGEPELSRRAEALRPGPPSGPGPGRRRPR